MTVCPTTSHLRIADSELLCAVRRRLGLAVLFQGPDPHGFRRLADNTGARLHARHTVMIAAWRQVFHEAGGQVPDRNIERMMVRTHLPVPLGISDAWIWSCLAQMLTEDSHYFVMSPFCRPKRGMDGLVEAPVIKEDGCAQ